MKNFASPVRNIERSWIREMSVLASRIPGTVSIGQGIPSFQLPKYIREGLIKRIQEQKDINKYSLQPGMPELKYACAKRIKDKKDIEVNPEKELFISVGAMEGLNSVIRAIIDNNDEVLFPSPTYEPHINLVKMYGGKPVFVPMVEQEGWRIDIDVIENAITEKTKAIILCNPSNPTGTVFERKEVIDLCAIANKHDIYIVSDEAYDFLVYDNIKHVSPLSIKKTGDKVISCFSFSKEFLEG